MPAGYDWLIFKLHEFSREPSLRLSAPRLPSAVFLNNLLLRPPYLYHSCSHCFLRLNSRPKSLPFVSQVQVRSNSNVTNDVTWRSHSFERNTPTCGFTASYNAARKMILWMSLASSWHWRVTRWRLSGQNSLKTFFQEGFSLWRFCWLFLFSVGAVRLQIGSLGDAPSASFGGHFFDQHIWKQSFEDFLGCLALQASLQAPANRSRMYSAFVAPIFGGDRLSNLCGEGMWKFLQL